MIANPPDATPAAVFVAKVTQGTGTTETTQSIPSGSFYTANDGGIGRITLGLGESTDTDVYWDDIKFEAFTPRPPTMGTSVVISGTSVAWSFAKGVDHTLYGFEVADGAGTIVSPQYPAVGWLNRGSSSWTETGLQPNTTYARKVCAWNGTLNSEWSNTVTGVTWSVPPGPSSVASARAGAAVQWSAVGGFGPGGVQYYRYAWDQSPTHTFTGDEPVWASGSLATQATAASDWYLHVQGFNAADVPNGTYDYLLSCGDEDADTVADCLDNCPGLTNPDQADSNGNGTGDACETHAVAAWRSVRTHRVQGPLSIALDAQATGNGLTGPTVETRGIPAQGLGLTTLEVDFDGPVSLSNPAAVTVIYWPTTGGVMGEATSITPTVTMADADTMRIELAGLPDGSCVSVAIGPGATAEGLTGDTDCMVRSLAANVTGSGNVSLGDLSYIKSRYGASAADYPAYDLNLSGDVSLGDMSFAKSRTAIVRRAICP